MQLISLVLPIQRWIERMAPFAKQLVPRQLLAFGGEGFPCTLGACRGYDDPASPVLPSGLASWMGNKGVDFVRNNAVPALDVATFQARPIAPP